jgi:predicted enzyme related to lactoylglutathione lyase
MDPIVIRVSTIRVFVTQLDRAVRFYAEVLGLKSEFRLEEYAQFDAGNVKIGVELVPPHEAAGHAGQFMGVSFETPDIHSACDALRSRGATITSPPEKMYWGGYLAHFTDPDGNTLSLVQYAPV